MNLLNYLQFTFFRNSKKNYFALNHENDKEVEIKSQCLITECSPVEDFNKLMEEGLNSNIGKQYSLLKILI